MEIWRFDAMEIEDELDKNGIRGCGPEVFQSLGSPSTRATCLRSQSSVLHFFGSSVLHKFTDLSEDRVRD